MSFFKYPATPHLAVLTDMDIRGDKVMSEAEREAFLDGEVVIEEKVDGANLGISFSPDGAVRLQNRGEYLHDPLVGQWKPLAGWLRPRLDLLFDLLEDRLILFGEWCYACHSVAYTKLPDWFLVFDVWDKAAGRFWSTRRRDALARSARLSTVKRKAQGRFRLEELKRFFSMSAYSDERVEGIYLRREDDEWLHDRAKLVRPAFVQAVEQHWTRAALRPNRIAAVEELDARDPEGEV